MKDYTDQSPVKCYYCKCGKAIEHAGDESKFDRATRKDFKQAEQWGRKVETITLAEFRKIQFGCNCSTPSN